MKFDVTVFADDLNAAGLLAHAVEEYGFDGLWVAEAAHNPFLPLAHAALATRRISIGTAIAVAFPRDPILMAKNAWDLAAQSQGRFILGLGTQIKPHITKRFSSRWGKPVQQMREYIMALRSAWGSFGTDQPARFRGEYYNFDWAFPRTESEQTPDFDIPIYVAGVNTGLARMAGELCDGFHVHSFHTPQYLRDVLIPAFKAGRNHAGISGKLSLSCAVFVVAGETENQIEESKILSKSQIAFYASTPSYSRVLELHGWQDLIPQLNTLLRRNRWNEMHTLISDDMLNHFAVIAPPDELAYRVRERYDGMLDRVGFYFPFEPTDQSRRIIWDHASKAMDN